MESANAAVMDSLHGTRPDLGAIASQRDSRVTKRSFLELGALPTAVPCARLHSRHVLSEWGLAPVTETAELLVSELVTNGLKAAWATGWNPPVSLTLSANELAVVIEVWDGNSQLPSVPELDGDVPRLDGEGGRGLFLVETLSKSWGWYPTRDPEGKVTWCVLQAAAALPSR